MNAIWQQFDLNRTKNERKQTPLHIAALAGNFEAVRLFCSYGSNPDLEDANGETPMQIALGLESGPSRSCVKALFDYGSSPYKAIQYCAEKNFTDMNLYIDELLKAKRDDDTNQIINLVFQGKKLRLIQLFRIKP